MALKIPPMRVHLFRWQRGTLTWPSLEHESETPQTTGGIANVQGWPQLHLCTAPVFAAVTIRLL